MKQRDKKNTDITENKYVTIPCGLLIIGGLFFLFVNDIEFLISIVMALISGYSGIFFLKRFGFRGKILTFIFCMPLLLIPRSVWESIDSFEQKK